MLENVGNTDRWVRVAIGSSLVLGGMWGSRRGGLVSALALGTGAMLLESAITRVCPVNDWLGIDTRVLDEPRLGGASDAPAATEGATHGPAVVVSDDGAMPV